MTEEQIKVIQEMIYAIADLADAMKYHTRNDQSSYEEYRDRAIKTIHKANDLLQEIKKKV